MRYSCVPSTEAHNSILQAAIEFGWFSAMFLILLVTAVAIPLLRIAGDDSDLRFAICCLVYVTVITFAHGRISRDITVFAFLGLGASLCQTFRR